MRIKILRKLIPFWVKEKLRVRSFYPFFVKLYVEKRIKSFSQKPSFRPNVVNIETTNACNAGCITCPHKKITREIGFMDMNLYQKLIDECFNLGVKEIFLHNLGEPLLDKTIGEKIKYAKSKRIQKVGFFTNASLLTKQKSQEIIEAGLDVIYISFDGAIKQTFEKVRSGLRYEQVVDNIENFLKFRRHHPKVYLYFVRCIENKKEIGLLKRQWKRKVDGINISVYRKRDSWDEVNRIHYAPCFYLWQEIFILWNGDIVSCCEDYDAKLVVGNVKLSGIAETWNSAKFQQIRQQHILNQSNNIVLCNSCELNLWWRWFLSK